jgi:hypothetical protein
MPFEKGQSGNPGGRSPIVTADGRSLTELAREHTEDAIACLAGVVADAKCAAAARVAASTALLDRGWGRPKQEMEVSTPEPMREMGHVDRAVRLAAIFAEIEGRKEGALIECQPVKDDA